MNAQGLKKRLSGGFRPFAIRTTDGQEFVIPHPEFILVGKYSIAVLDKQGFINNLDPLHIVSARDLARRNGNSLNRREGNYGLDQEREAFEARSGTDSQL